MSTWKSTLGKVAGAPGARELFRPWTRNRAVVFMLHRFSRGAGKPGHFAEVLEACLDHLTAAGYRALTLGELCAEVLGGGPRSRTVCLTVDDGYLDFADVAFPILSRRGVGATVFVARDFIDGTAWYWWDRIEYAFRHGVVDHVTVPMGNGHETAYTWRSEEEREAVQKSFTVACKAIPDAAKWEAIGELEKRLGVRVPARPTPDYEPMTWNDVRRLQKGGIEFGGHTVTHPILSRLSPERAEAEIVEGLAAIERNTGVRPRTFAYPNGQSGDFTPHTIEILERHGVLGAVTGEHGIVSRKLLRSLDKPLYRLPRVSMPSTLEGFIHAVSGVEAFKQDLGYG